MSRREKILWLIVGFAYIVGLLSLIPSYHQVCEIAEKAKEEHCTTYQFVPFVLIKLGKLLDAMGAAITALATIAIAWFTLTLRRSTDKLWFAGEAQRELAERTAEMQLRAYISVESGKYIRQDKQFRFEFRPIIVNNGPTPAKNVSIQTNVGLVPIGIPDSFDYTFGPGVKGPQTSISDIGPRKDKFNATVFHRRATIAELRGILKGTHYFHVYGKVMYQDVFGHDRIANYSFTIFVPAKRGLDALWFATDRHNDAT